MELINKLREELFWAAFDLLNGQAEFSGAQAAIIAAKTAESFEECLIRRTPPVAAVGQEIRVREGVAT